jgi:hypothetical protein
MGYNMPQGVGKYFKLKKQHTSTDLWLVVVACWHIYTQSHCNDFINDEFFGHKTVFDQK